MKNQYIKTIKQRQKIIKTFEVLAVIVSVLILIYIGYFLGALKERSKISEQINQIELEILHNQEELNNVRQELEKLEYIEKSIDALKNDVDIWLELFEIKPTVVTAYAPSDGVEGMDYEGDPNVTASGDRPIPFETGAAGRNVPFGTRVYIPDIGLITINDRGGIIGEDDLDVVFRSRREAFQWGSQMMPVIWERI